MGIVSEIYAQGDYIVTLIPWTFLEFPIISCKNSHWDLYMWYSVWSQKEFVNVEHKFCSFFHSFPVPLCLFYFLFSFSSVTHISIQNIVFTLTLLFSWPFVECFLYETEDFIKCLYRTTETQHSIHRIIRFDHSFYKHGHNKKIMTIATLHQYYMFTRREKIV